MSEEILTRIGVTYVVRELCLCGSGERSCFDADLLDIFSSYIERAIQITRIIRRLRQSKLYFRAWKQMTRVKLSKRSNAVLRLQHVDRKVTLYRCWKGWMDVLTYSKDILKLHKIVSSYRLSHWLERWRHRVLAHQECRRRVIVLVSFLRVQLLKISFRSWKVRTGPAIAIDRHVTLTLAWRLWVEAKRNSDARKHADFFYHHRLLKRVIESWTRRRKSRDARVRRGLRVTKAVQLLLAR